MRSLLPVFAIVLPLGAQWIRITTPGIPRNSNGTPNLNAPAPRLADGTPDLAGIWRFSPPFNNDYTTGLKPEEILPWARELYTQRRDGNLKDQPSTHCLPGAVIDYGVFMKIVQTPGLILLLSEIPGNNTTRQIHLDGRVLPVDPNPTWQGYSVAHWEADTLVVETSGYNDRVWLDHIGHPHTEALRVIERFRRRDFGHLDVEITFNDPGAYTRSWSINIPRTVVADTEIFEAFCENERDSRHFVGQ